MIDQETEAVNTEINVSPNPFATTVTLQFSNLKPDHIEVIDITGRVVEIKYVGDVSSQLLG